MSVEDIAQDEIEALWIEEAIRRDDESETGSAKMIPADEVLSRARERCRS